MSSLDGERGKPAIGYRTALVFCSSTGRACSWYECRKCFLELRVLLLAKLAGTGGVGYCCREWWCGDAEWGHGEGESILAWMVDGERHSGRTDMAMSCDAMVGFCHGTVQVGRAVTVRESTKAAVGSERSADEQLRGR